MQGLHAAHCFWTREKTLEDVKSAHGQWVGLEHSFHVAFLSLVVVLWLVRDCPVLRMPLENPQGTISR